MKKVTLIMVLLLVLLIPVSAAASVALFPSAEQQQTAPLPFWQMMAPRP